MNVLNALMEKELLTPKEISKVISLRLNHVSMTLSELKNLTLVECVNEKSKRGRLYKITELGKKTIKWIKDN
jgi:DNA-binding MarR family transcriptional regulator